MKPRKNRTGTVMESVTKLSYTSLFLLWITLTAAFACTYFALHRFAPSHGPLIPVSNSLWLQFGNSVYFSVITATTTGFGDITPHGFSKVLAGIQAIISFFVFGVFITKLVANRQELELEKVYRLTSEDTFHNTREGLYIVRNDFDRMIETAEEKRALVEQDWEDLATAFKQCETLLTQIPDFYDEDHRLYVIDERREQLLQEAVHRTLHRINKMLDVFSKNGIDWTTHERCDKELRSLVDIVGTTLPFWKERSPYEQGEAFEDILSVSESMRAKIGRIV